MIILAFLAGVVVGVTGFIVILMLDDEPKPARRMSTIINTEFMKKTDD